MRNHYTGTIINTYGRIRHITNFTNNIFRGNKMKFEICFQCQKCAKCCQLKGDVLLTKQEISDIANFLNISEKSFISQYCYIIEKEESILISIKHQPHDNSCIFLKNNRCIIYDVRPIQCSTYPFWTFLLNDEIKWQNEKKLCPGIGKGKKISKRKLDSLEKDFNENDYIIPNVLCSEKWSGQFARTE